MTKLSTALTKAQNRLDRCSDSPRLDAEVLLAHVLGRPRSYLMAWPQTVLEPKQEAVYSTLLAERARGRPVAYLTGQTEFWSLPLRVTPATLIPRPETELLVEEALRRLPAGQPADVLDLGTGAAAIALALAWERPSLTLTATDISAQALAVARENARLLNIANVDFVASDWFKSLHKRRFDLIVANPPYIAESESHLLQDDVRFEPESALFSGQDGLDAIRVLVAQSPSHLYPESWLLVEHGFKQGKQIRALMRQFGFEQIQTTRDLLGHERVTAGRFTVAACESPRSG